MDRGDEWRDQIESCLQQLRGATIESATAVIPEIRGKLYDRMDAIEVKVKDGPLLRIDFWESYADDASLEITESKEAG